MDLVKKMAFNPFYASNLSFTLAYKSIELFGNIIYNITKMYTHTRSNPCDNIEIILPNTIEYEIAKLDIMYNVNVTNSMLMFIELNHRCNTFLKNKIKPMFELINEIQELYNVILSKIEQHKQKLFSQYRSLHLNEIEHLILLNNILLQRRQDLYEVLKLTSIDIGKCDVNTNVIERRFMNENETRSIMF